MGNLDPYVLSVNDTSDICTQYTIANYIQSYDPTGGVASCWFTSTTSSCTYAHRAASGLDSWDSKPIGAGD